MYFYIYIYEGHCSYLSVRADRIFFSRRVYRLIGTETM